MRLNQLFVFGVVQFLSFGGLLLIYSQIEFQSTQTIQTNALIENQHSTILLLTRTVEKMESDNQHLTQQLDKLTEDISEKMFQLLVAQQSCGGEADSITSETFGFCSQDIVDVADEEPQIAVVDVSKKPEAPVTSVCYHMDKIKSNEFELCMYPPEQDLISLYINNDGMWEGSKTLLLSIFFREQLLLPNHRTVVLDLGANQGYYGFNAASFGYKVYMVEPGPSNVDLLRQTVIKNNFQNHVTIMQNAIGNVRQPVRFNFSPGNSGASTISPGGGEGQIFHSILPDDIPKHFGFKTTDIFLVKTDVEGFDFHAYDGMKRIIIEGRPSVLIMEFSKRSDCNTESMIRKLYDLGYLFIQDEKPNEAFTYEDVINFPDLREAVFIHKDAFPVLAAHIAVHPRWYEGKKSN